MAVDEGDRRDVDRALLIAQQHAAGRGEPLTIFGAVALPEPWLRLFERQAPTAQIVVADAPPLLAAHLAAVVCCPCLNCTALALLMASGALRGGGQMIVDQCSPVAQARQVQCVSSHRPALRWYALRAFGLVEPGERRRDWRVVSIGADVLVAERI